MFYFEKATSIIGIGSAHPQLREAFPFRANNSSFTLMAIPFCRRFGIHIEGTEAFTDPEIDDHGILQLSLRSTRRVGGWRKKKRREAGA